MTYPNAYDRPQARATRAPAPVDNPGTPIEAGTLKFFNVDKGYGFIVTDTGDLFVHISAFQRAGREVPEKGAPLRFQRGRSRDQRELALVLHP